MADRLSESLKVTHYDEDAATATNAHDIGWVDMKDYDAIMVTAFASALTGVGVTAFSILGNTASDGSGSDVTITSHAVGSAPDAVGDYLVLECNKDEIVAAGETLRYVSANVTMANAADENVVTYIRRAKTLKASNTADVVA